MDDNTRKHIAKYVEDLHSLVSHGLLRKTDESAQVVRLNVPGRFG